MAGNYMWLKRLLNKNTKPDPFKELRGSDPIAPIDEGHAIFPEPVAALPPIYLTKQRDDDALFDAPKSWLGGLPSIAIEDWPHIDGGFAMYHLATLDLQEIAHVAPDSPLPKKGQLVFFVNSEHETGGAHVMHVSDPKPARATGQLPDTLEPPACGHVWGHFSQLSHLDEPRVLPRWPLRVSAKPADPRIGEGISLNPRSMADILPRGTQPWLWDSAQRLVAGMARTSEQLQGALGRAERQLTKAEEALAKVIANEQGLDPDRLNQWTKSAEAEVRLKTQFVAQLTQPDAYQAFCAEMSRVADAHSPWDVMSPDDLNWLEDVVSQIDFDTFNDTGSAFGASYKLSSRQGFSVPRLDKNGERDLSGLNEDTLTALAAAPVSVFRNLPPKVQNAITRYAQGRSHQMFGTPDPNMESTDLNAQKHLLLEVTSDHLAGIFGGGRSSYCFYMRGSDLRAQDWNQATLSLGYVA